MLFSRRLLCFLVPFVLAATPLSAKDGWPRSKGDDARGLTREMTGKYSEVTMRIVRNLPWLPDGKESKAGEKQKYLYVIYTPSCPISQEFYDSTRKLAETMQIRWIPIDPDGSLNSMYEQRTAETVRRAFKSSMVPPDNDTKKTEAIQTYNMAGIAYLLVGQMVSPDGNLYFPTMIYGTPEKAFVTIGPAKDLKKLVANIPETEEPQQPEALTLGATKPEIVRPSSIPMYVNKGKERVALRMAPDKNSIEVGALAPGDKWEGPINGVTKNGFVAFAVSSKGAPIYAEDPDFVQSILADKK